MSARRHAAQRTSRRGRLVAGCVVVFVLPVVVVVVVRISGTDGHRSASGLSPGAATENAPMDAVQGPEHAVVPEACEALSVGIAGRLVPDAQRSETTATQSDQHSECAWSQYGSSRTRQLTVELRAVGASGGTSATGVAIRTFDDEWHADREGRDLTGADKVQDSRGVTEVGEQAYVVYTVNREDEIGEALANARLANVLITVHYSGGNNRHAAGTPLSSQAATDGALSAARDLVSTLESHS